MSFDSHLISKDPSEQSQSMILFEPPIKATCSWLLCKRIGSREEYGQ